MIKFPSINQFRHLKKSVGFIFGDTDRKLEFRGTVKLHGTNAAIVIEKTGGDFKVKFQSRNNEITPDSDNSGFATYMTEVGTDKLIGLARPLLANEKTSKVILFGEWCGGNIQKGVALSDLDKMFVIFAVKEFSDDPGNGRWIDLADYASDLIDADARIFNTELFETWSAVIDFNSPEMSVNDLVAITEQVEKECPAGKHFNVSGVGEGVVWRCNDDPSSELWFKVKGEKHSVTKVKKLVEVDTVKLGSIVDFVDRVVTLERVNQGINYLSEQGLELSRKSTGTFMSWFFADVMKEESDVLEASGLTKKDVSGKIGEKARNMFFSIVDF